MMKKPVSTTTTTMTTTFLSFIVIAVIIAISTLPDVVTSRSEEERIAHYHSLNHTWPPAEYIPNTPGWRKLFEHRLRQVEEIEDRTERFEGFAQAISAGVLQPNFTEYGFGLARAPESLMVDLRKGVHDGYQKEGGPRLESYINAITEPRPWFIDRPDLTTRVLDELQDYSEAWAGFPLTPVTAYGFRLYRNTSRLHVHVDKTATHVISFILHIDSSDDADPWPILIEDLNGVTHEVTLTSGDILFYESSKCFHGRPRPFNGTWYSSVFVHYYPTHGYKETFDEMGKVNRIPPHWADEPTSQYEIPLRMHGTTMEEPSCDNFWCNTKFSNKWSGPGEEGYVIEPGGNKRVLDIAKVNDCKDRNKKCREWSQWESKECEANASFMHVTCPRSCNICSISAPGSSTPVSSGGDGGDGGDGGISDEL